MMMLFKQRQYSSVKEEEEYETVRPMKSESGFGGDTDANRKDRQSE